MVYEKDWSTHPADMHPCEHGEAVVATAIAAVEFYDDCGESFADHKHDNIPYAQWALYEGCDVWELDSHMRDNFCPYCGNLLPTADQLPGMYEDWKARQGGKEQAMRKVEEIKADMDKALGCMCNRHGCNNECETCQYINYEKNFFRLKQENYQVYVDAERKEKAIIGVDTDRLETLCAAEREGRCYTPPCKLGKIVYVVEADAKKMQNFSPVSLKIRRVKFDLWMMDLWEKCIFPSESAAQAYIDEVGLKRRPKAEAAMRERGGDGE
jgi:hypothetical protein